MTYVDSTPPPATATHPTSWEPCDHCQAPLAERQRYCVVCGARRSNADDPAARYFVAAARRARTPEAPPASAAATDGGAPSRIWFALVLALLPLVAALGIVVGRGSGSDQQLVDALKAQKAPVVNIVGGSGGAASDSAAASADDDGGSASKASGKSDPVDGEVIAHTRYGNARRLTDARVTPEQIEESRRALDHIVNSKGRAYVEQQRNLPDQIVIP